MIRARFEPMRPYPGMIIVNEKGKGTFVCAAEVDEFSAVCGQLPYQCEGRALRKQMLKLAERISGLALTS
jgi:hypothetical protein